MIFATSHDKLILIHLDISQIESDQIILTND